MTKLLFYFLFFSVVCSLLIAISLPNFIGAQDRASPRTRYRYLVSELNRSNSSQAHNTESYQKYLEPPFQSPMQAPLSTFGLDVDTASYSNMRRFIDQGVRPPQDAIRTEELINYFSYQYPGPSKQELIAVNAELSECPWQKGHQLLRLGLKAKSIELKNAPTANLVFLIDVSGSMQDMNKLPMVKRSLSILLEQLRPLDRVAIVVYAGAAGLVLPSTSGKEKNEILSAIEKLEAGGSTAGGQGIQLAYQVARQNWIPKGNNRVILATDGDFNVGTSSDAEMVRLIEKERRSGVFLTVLGYGMGNYKDSKLEQIADAGNGNHAYIDSLAEAQKVLGKEFGANMLTLAKDVKLQVEFNPLRVKEYRLIGYENRKLEAQDFKDDHKDAGELGSGQTMTAIYQIQPASGTEEKQSESYFQTNQIKPAVYKSEELFRFKMRYKSPQSKQSQLFERSFSNKPVPFDQSSRDFKLATVLTGLGLYLRDSELKGQLVYDQLLQILESIQASGSSSQIEELMNLMQRIPSLKTFQLD